MRVMRFLHGYQGTDFADFIAPNAIVIPDGTPQMGGYRAFCGNWLFRESFGQDRPQVTTLGVALEGEDTKK
jgi:hypothetical protein